MVKIYETKEARDVAWKAQHTADHPGCNFFMPECDFYTEEKLIAYAYTILDETENYPRYFNTDSMWAEGNIFADTRKDLIGSFDELDETLQGAYLSRESLLNQYRSDLISHALERGMEYDSYDAGSRIHAGDPSIDVQQTPLCTLLLDRTHKAIMFLMSHNQDVSKYV